MYNHWLIDWFLPKTQESPTMYTSKRFLFRLNNPGFRFRHHYEFMTSSLNVFRFIQNTISLHPKQIPSRNHPERKAENKFRILNKLTLECQVFFIFGANKWRRDHLKTLADLDNCLVAYCDMWFIHKLMFPSNWKFCWNLLVNQFKIYVI